MGELAGARQSGGLGLRFFYLDRECDVIDTARRVAARILERDPTLSAPEHEALRKRIERRYERGIELFRLG